MRQCEFRNKLNIAYTKKIVLQIPAYILACVTRYVISVNT